MSAMVQRLAIFLILSAQISSAAGQSDRYSSSGGPISDPQISDPSLEPEMVPADVQADPSDPDEFNTPPVSEPAKLRPSRAAPARADKLDFRNPFDKTDRSSAATDQLVPVRSRPENRTAAATILHKIHKQPDPDSPDVRPLTLVEALSSRQPGTDRLNIVIAYWELSTRVAVHRFAKSQLDEIKSIRSSREADDAAIAAAHADAAADLADADLALIEARHNLQELRGPLGHLDQPSHRQSPVDVPHTGSYRTEFDRLFAGSLASVEAKRIHEMLPAGHASIRAWAKALAAAEIDFTQKTQQYKHGEIDVDRLLESHMRVGTRRRQFLATVRQYNNQIGRYVAIAVPGPANELQVARMLIKNPVEPRRFTQNPAVTPATATQAVAPSMVEPQRLSTAVADSNELPSVLKRSGVVPAVPQQNDSSKVVPAVAEEPLTEARTQPVENDPPTRDGFRARRDP